MKRIIAAAAVLAAAPLVAACGSGLSHGTITGKSYSPPSSYVIVQCMAWGKYGCNVYLPVTYYNDAEWSLSLKDGTQTGSVDVDQATWDAAKVGQHWPPAGAS